MTDSNNSSHSPVILGPFLALIGFLAFSVHDSLVKILPEYSVFQILFFAMLFGYVPFTVVRLLDKKPAPLKAVNPKLVILRAVLLMGSVSSAFLAFSMLPLIEVYVLIFLSPIIISILSIHFLGEKVHVFRWFAIIIGLVGVLIVLRPTIDTLTIGHLFGFLAAICSSSAAIISRKIAATENAATLMLFPMLTTILVTGCILPFVYKPMPLADLGIMFMIGALGLTGQLFNLFAYKSSPAAFIAPMQYSQIIWAVIFGSLFFNEVADKWEMIGSAVTVFSGVMIIWREVVVSKIQPTLNTRNTRMVGAAPAPAAPTVKQE
ncbi:DMT family transporter [Leucothrix arctica]|uniref:EamA/RhaT family transporter n=1 Tax=Leucothrix arctica TaxID=1481894 RepID=A0A317CC65_9GAMM|nr:DMT family transporter [Leucothrix arctica]PWQ95969.1 EamA/RhaT family transporter [Leucothrix arctica]